MGWWPETGWTDRKISHIKIYGIGRYIIRKLHIKWNLMCAIKISSLSACLRDSYENVCCTFGPRFIRASPESRSIYGCTGMTGTWECYSFGRLASFSCKLHLEIVDSTISCKNTNCKEVFPVFLHLCKKIGRKKWFIRNAYKRKQVYENIGRRIKLSNSEKNIKSVKMPWCFGNFERN